MAGITAVTVLSVVLLRVARGQYAPLLDAHARMVGPVVRQDRAAEWRRWLGLSSTSTTGPGVVVGAVLGVVEPVGPAGRRSAGPSRWRPAAIIAVIPFVVWTLALAGLSFPVWGWALMLELVVGLRFSRTAVLTGVAFVYLAPAITSNSDSARGSCERRAGRSGTGSAQATGDRVVATAQERARRRRRASASGTDLHDGAQQRLVALAMELGIARARAGGARRPGRPPGGGAHEEAKRAIVELSGIWCEGSTPQCSDKRARRRLVRLVARC
ncbi:MAG: hypothetical protein R2705_13720 [Ilumatobacteraceae bacterium]